MAEEKVQTISRKDVDAQILAQKFSCRGPNLHTVEERKAFQKRLNEAATPEDHQKLLDEVAKSTAGKKGVRARTVAELHKAADTPDKVRALLFGMIHGHADSIDHAMCGANVSELIVKDGKYDGENHEVTCPKCGTVHVYSKQANLEAEPEKK